jgi:hypothetical protein
MSAASGFGIAIFATLPMVGARTALHATFTAEPADRAGSSRSIDTHTVTRAEYVVGLHRLYVEAKGPNSSATLRVSITSTNQMLGTLTNRGRGEYSGEFTWPTNPQHVTVLNIIDGSVESVPVTLG